MSGLRIETGVETTTRDGVVLRSDVYRLDDDVPRPALLHRTPYDRTDPTLVAAIVADPVALARAGYAVVVQDVRGRGSSEGTFDFGEQEHDDGYDAVEWVAAQEWCDGRVGVYGSSYHAITAYAALAAAPPHLAAALVMVGAADLAATVRPGGAFELGFLTAYSLGQGVAQVLHGDRPAQEKADLVQRAGRLLGDLPTTVARLPLSEVDVLGDPSVAPWWQTWLHDESGGYVTRSLAREHPLPDVPLLSVVGWRDFMQASMLTAYARRRPGDRHRLVAGPWAHNGTYTGAVGARSFAAAPGGVGVWQRVVQGWFDRWLRPDAAPVAAPLARRLLDGPPVAWFTTGSDRWSAGEQWPPAEAGPVHWHLDADGALGTSPGSGTTSYVHDARDPVPTVGGVLTCAPLGPDGVQDQAARQRRPDVAVWTSPVLATGVEVAGEAVLTLRVSSTGEDTDVVVVLSDVEPSGFVAGVAEGVLRLRARDGGTRDWLVPGTAYDVSVALHHTAHLFAKGHRVRVDVAGSSFPRLSRNLGTREVPELGRLEDAATTTQTVHHEGSRLTLPVLPRPT